MKKKSKLVQAFAKAMTMAANPATMIPLFDQLEVCIVGAVRIRYEPQRQICLATWPDNSSAILFLKDSRWLFASYMANPDIKGN